MTGALLGESCESWELLAQQRMNERDSVAPQKVTGILDVWMWWAKDKTCYKKSLLWPPVVYVSGEVIGTEQVCVFRVRTSVGLLTELGRCVHCPLLRASSSLWLMVYRSSKGRNSEPDVSKVTGCSLSGSWVLENGILSSDASSFSKHYYLCDHIWFLHCHPVL